MFGEGGSGFSNRNSPHGNFWESIAKKTKDQRKRETAETDQILGAFGAISRMGYQGISYASAKKARMIGPQLGVVRMHDAPEISP